MDLPVPAEAEIRATPPVGLTADGGLVGGEPPGRDRHPTAVVDSVDERNYPEKLWIAAALPDLAEQDMEGFELSDREKKKAKVEVNERTSGE